MPKFKEGDKIKFRSYARQICKTMGVGHQECWHDRGEGVIVSSNNEDTYGTRWNTRFQKRSGGGGGSGAMWVYERIIQNVDDDDDCMVDTSDIHKLLDRLIKNA